MTKSSMEDREHDGEAGEKRRSKKGEQHAAHRLELGSPEIHGGFLGVPANGKQTPANDDHHKRNRECDVSQELGPGPEGNKVVNLGEDQKQGHPHHDLEGHEGDQHQQVGRT